MKLRVRRRGSGRACEHAPRIRHWGSSEGSVVFILLLFLGLIAMAIAINTSTLVGLRQELRLLEKKHQQRLEKASPRIEQVNANAKDRE